MIPYMDGFGFLEQSRAPAPNAYNALLRFAEFNEHPQVGGLM